MKNLKFAAFTFATLLLTVTNVYAKEVSTSEALLDCLKEDGTCTLTTDVEFSDRLIVEKGITSVLDLNGKTMSMTHESDLYAGLIKGNLTIKGNGTLNIANLYGFGVTGNLTIENGTFNNQEGFYMIGSWGTTTIKNGTFNGSYSILNVFSGKSVIENGTFNSELYKNEDDIEIDDARLYYWSLLASDSNSLEVKKGTFNHILSYGNYLTDESEVTYSLEALNTIDFPIAIKGKVTLDLNGYTVSYDESRIDDSDKTLFNVLNNGKLIINDSKGNGKITTDSTNKIKTAIKMTDNSEFILNNGTITGGTAIEIDGGTLNINGGTIHGTGNTENNAGIIVSEPTSNISVNVKDGTVRGFYALHQSTTESNNLANNINLNITGGTFEVINNGTTVIYSEDKTEFILGGKYSIEPTEKYIVSPYKAKKDGNQYVIALSTEEVNATSSIVNTKEEVKEVTAGVAKTDEKSVNEVLVDSLAANKELVAGSASEDKIEVKLEMDKENVSNESKELIEDSKEVEGLTLVDYFNAAVNVYVDGNIVGNIAELTGTVKLTVVLPNKLQEAKKGYTRMFYLVREHDGKIEKIKADLSEDGKAIIAETDKFSTYAVAYEDVILPPKTGDNIVGYFVIAFISLIALIGTTLITKKHFN